MFDDERWKDSYDAWKLRGPDWDQPDPECSACDDAGCPSCGCPDEPVTLDDISELLPLSAYEL